MTESLWLETFQENGSQLLLVKDHSKQVLLKQLPRPYAIADPWRGQFVCVWATPSKKPCVATLSADGDLAPLVDLPEDVEWRPCSFSSDGKRLLLSGQDALGNVCALALCRIDEFEGEHFAVDNVLRANTGQRFFAPQFSEGLVGVFVAGAGSSQVCYHEWSVEHDGPQSLVALGFPSVDMSPGFGWSRTEDGQFIHLICDLPALNRQQFARLVSGDDTPVLLGKMVPKLDAVVFSTASSFAYFAHSSILGVFDFELADVVESMPLHNQIVLGLNDPTEHAVRLHLMDDGQTRLGQWKRGEAECESHTTLSLPVLSWGSLAVDLPRSQTQTFSLEELVPPRDTRLNTDSVALSTRNTDSDDTHSYNSALGAIDERPTGASNFDLKRSNPDEDTRGDVPVEVTAKAHLSEVPTKEAVDLNEANDHLFKERQSNTNESISMPDDCGSTSDGGDTHQAIQTNAGRAAIRPLDLAESQTNTTQESTRQEMGGTAQAAPKEQPRALVYEPDQDFKGWISQTAEHEDPEVRLRVLKAFRKNQVVIEQSVEHLKMCLESLSSDEDLVLEVIVAIAAVAELRAQPARPLLEQMCGAARARLLEHSTLPFVEEHFSLAALRALDQPEGRFSLVVVYEEYEQIIETVTREDVSEDQRSKILKKTSTRYRRALEHVLFDQGKRDSAKSRVNQAEKSAKTVPSVSPAKPEVELDSAALAPQAYRFKPLAQRFPSHAQPWQPKGASVSDRASSDILRLEDFGPSGDESFQASIPMRRSPKWIKNVLFGMSGLGGFLSLIVLMLGFEYAPILIVGGLCLGLGSVTILGNAFKHWVAGNILFIVGVLALIIVPNIEASLPEALGPWVFWGPACVFIVFLGVLLNGEVRESFSQSRLLEAEFD